MATRTFGRDRPEIQAHKDWLGYVQPEGLLVSIPALERAQAWINKNATTEQEALVDLVGPKAKDGSLRPDAHLTDFARFTQAVLGWEPTDLVPPPPESFEAPLREYGETLRPDFIVPSPALPMEGRGQGPRAPSAPLPIAQILVSIVPAALDLDRPRTDTPWPASPEARLERLLRDTSIPIGLLTNLTHIRLVYAPSGESSGHATFPIVPMCEPSGRPMLAALVMLLGADRLFALEEARRLPAILRESRRYQNVVSTRLSEQVLAALHELLRGFEAADRATQNQLLGETLRSDATHVYGGLLGTLLRLVFILYAEDRGLMPSDPTYARSYSVAGLFEKLREDAARYPDTMDQRYGAWARLLVLFRLIHDGGRHGALELPPRYGRIFDPDAYPFLEGRPYGSARQKGETLSLPRVSDGVVHRVLQNLLLLDGDRLSYRALDVEQIGSVYEAMMGFAVEVVTEPSIAIRPHHVVVGLESLLEARPAERLKRLADLANCKPSGKAQDAVKGATTLDELAAALGKSISPRTPHLLAAGSLILQPTEERRRSGSHYTPRVLTEPIVATTLRPILEALGPKPTPEQLLDLKVCDPAMGSGAFLVATCRALGSALRDAWQHHGGPTLPPDEDPRLHAQRLVSQRCLYGVDKNPFAVDLAKLSLWLVTLAKGHPFTFLDHALPAGVKVVAA